jgi:hypothetical protein
MHKRDSDENRINSQVDDDQTDEGERHPIQKPKKLDNISSISKDWTSIHEMLNGIYESLRKAEEILSPFKQIEEIAKFYKANEGTTPSAVTRSVLSNMLLSFTRLNNLLRLPTGASEIKQMNDTIKEMTESVTTLTDLSKTSMVSLDRTIAGVKAIPETTKVLGPAKEDNFTSSGLK